MHRVRTGRELLKNIILGLLLATSIVQIGILWGNQIHGFPFNFLMSVINPGLGSNVSDAAAIDELFVPYRISISDGDTDKPEHWFIGSEDETFDRLWKNAKPVLRELVGKSPVKTYTDIGFWATTTSKKGVEFEFRNNLNSELSSWFLDVPGIAPAIYKIFIIPEGEDVKNLEVYLFSSNGSESYKIEKYLVSRNLWDLNKDEEDKLLMTLSEDTKYQLSNFSLINEYLDIPGLPDVPVAVNPPKFRPYKNIVSKIPETISTIGGENADEELAKIVLGNKIDSYNRESFADSAQFKNADSIYTIYKNGLLDYRYIPGEDANKGDIQQAMMNAYKFISMVKQLNKTKAVLQLSEVDASQPGKYVFKFDYAINNRPIFFNISLDKGETQLQNAITIDANEKRVLRCRWMLRDIRLTGTENEYNAYFLDIAADEAVAEDLKKIFIRNMDIGYVISSEQQEEVTPVMVVEKPDPGIYVIKMPVRGD